MLSPFLTTSPSLIYYKYMMKDSLTKFCGKCKIIKSITDFYYRNDRPHLRQSHCKECVAKKSKENRLLNIEYRKKRDRIYHEKNRQKRIDYLKKYNTENKEAKNAYFKNKYHADFNYKMRQNIATRIRRALKTAKNTSRKTGSTFELIGCTLDFLKSHLESKFLPNMNWENYGLWSIDHIKPCALFDLSTKEEQKKCFNYKNLQPLWQIDNIKKRDKYTINEKEVCHR